MPVTIRDVAHRLNLSITTVSRALDGYPDVAEETRKLVIQTAEDMGYTPNRAARQLRRKRADTVGYILPALKPQFGDPFFAEFIAGLGDEAAGRNIDLLVSAAPPDNPAEKLLYQRWAQGHKVDGFILTRMRLSDWRANFLESHKTPFASLESAPDSADPLCIEVDSVAGIRALFAHLAGLGHRRIAYIGGWSQLKIHATRYNAYLACLDEYSLPAEPGLVAESDLTSGGGFQAAHELLAWDNPPTAIICINDLTAFGALHAAHERGLHPGKQLAVAGFDGLADAAHTDPPLTTLNQPVYDIARQLLDMLLAGLNGNPPSQRRVVLQPELIIRASTTG